MCLVASVDQEVLARTTSVHTQPNAMLCASNHLFITYLENIGTCYISFRNSISAASIQASMPIALASTELLRGARNFTDPLQVCNSPIKRTTMQVWKKKGKEGNGKLWRG